MIINDDIQMAFNIIDNNIVNDSFDINSPIYKTTNETLSHKEYIETLKNKKRVLSIIGSGDHIINSIMMGSRQIVGIDISRFPKYFLFLKLAAIKTLTKNDYLKFFHGSYDNAFLFSDYSIIRYQLDHNTRLFWDNLYNKYSETKIYNSKLFHNFSLTIKNVILMNPFLQEDNYTIIKNNLKDVDISTIDDDILNINKMNIDNFDLIILSNIINCIMDKYGFNSNELFKFYKKFLSSLPLNKNGEAITYNLPFYPHFKDNFNSKRYNIYSVHETVNNVDLNSEILVYRKK